MIKKIIKETMRNFKNKRKNFLNEEDNSITRKSDYKNLMNYDDAKMFTSEMHDPYVRTTGA